MNIDGNLKQIIAIVANGTIDISEINEMSILTSDLGFDSVQIIEMIVEIETRFGIEIEDADLDIENITVYKKLFEIIVKKINK